jgi:hypothetical protein
MAISTKNIDSGSGSGSSVPKTLSPGVQVFKINSISLETVPYKQEAYNIVLNVEGPDMGEDFEGFFIDKDNPTLGRYKGQVGKIRLTEYPLADGTTKTGIVIKRDAEILRQVDMICKNLEMKDWLEAQDNLHNTIEDLVKALDRDRPFANKFVRACVAGREYINKQNYTNFDLYLPKWSKNGSAYELASVDEAVSKVVKFDPEVHVRKAKTETVSSFGNATPTTNDVAGDFVL